MRITLLRRVVGLILVVTGILCELIWPGTVQRLGKVQLFRKELINATEEAGLGRSGSAQCLPSSKMMAQCIFAAKEWTWRSMFNLKVVHTSGMSEV